MITPTSSTRILHVSPTGSELASGTADAPFRSIQHAAEQARPGDTVRIHAGIYRERVDPPRGGDSPESPITFEAAGDGEAV
ncbi:MAG: xylosidase, partial [Kiritimatiellia bacterium]